MKATLALVLVAIAVFWFFRPSNGKTPAPPVRVPVAATAVRNPITVAPAPTGKTPDRLKTGPNAQNDWKPSSGSLKTGPNAQTDLKPNPGVLKTGPNAQTDLKPDSGRLKAGPNAQTDLTLKRSW